MSNNLESVYSYPELYERLYTYPSSYIAKLESLILRYFPRGVARMLDPTCGGGRWFQVFKPRHGFGADIDPAMIAHAQQKDWRWPNEFCVGSMVDDYRELFEFSKGHCDCAINFDSIDHLQDNDEVLKHLVAVCQCLAIHGIYFLGVRLSTNTTCNLPLVYFESKQLPIESGGTASLTITSLKRRGTQLHEIVEFELLTEGSSVYPSRLKTQFQLLQFEFNELLRLTQRAGYCLENTIEIHPPHFVESTTIGQGTDYLLVLRKL